MKASVHNEPGANYLGIPLKGESGLEEFKEIPLLNEDAILLLKQLKNSDGVSLFEIQIPRFAAKAQETIESFRKRLTAAELDILSQEAHKLKSTCGVVGASRMFAICGRIEKQGRELGTATPQEKSAVFDSLIAALSDCLTETLSALNRS